MQQIKQNPEDFIVEEVINLEKSQGDFLYVKITKKNLNTLDVIQEISKQLKLERKNIGFAGNKDKNAITTQYFSLYKVKIQDIKKIKIQNVNIIPLFYGNRPITLGSLIANNFRIKYSIRNKRFKMNFLANYYGDQRFSSNNKDIGKAILLKDFRKACNLINNDKIKNHLTKKPSDPIGALKLLDRNLLSLYINSFQSYLWNEVAKTHIKQNNKRVREYENLHFVERPKSNITIPLISFDTNFKNKAIKNLYFNLLRKENVNLQDYYNNPFSYIISKTGYRRLFVKIQNFRIDRDYIEFQLPKGSYATALIKQLEALK